MFPVGIVFLTILLLLLLSWFAKYYTPAHAGRMRWRNVATCHGWAAPNNPTPRIDRDVRACMHACVHAWWWCDGPNAYHTADNRWWCVEVRHTADNRWWCVEVRGRYRVRAHRHNARTDLLRSVAEIYTLSDLNTCLPLLLLLQLPQQQFLRST